LISLGLVSYTQGIAQSSEAVDDLVLAARSNELPKVEQMIKTGMDPDTSDPQGNTLLIIAASEGHFDMAKYLLSQRAKVRERNAFGDTPLMLAALHGHLELVRLLAAYGADLNPPGWTPLHYCAWEGHTDVCALLVELGTQVNARAVNGATPLMMAAHQGKLETVRWLLDHGADPGLRTDVNATALDWAIKYDNSQVAELLRNAPVR